MTVCQCKKAPHPGRKVCIVLFTPQSRKKKMRKGEGKRRKARKKRDKEEKKYCMSV